MNEPNNYQQRVLDEKQALDEKIEKLDAFIKFRPAFRPLKSPDKHLLISQLSVMRSYSNLLKQRIARFNQPKT